MLKEHHGGGGGGGGGVAALREESVSRRTTGTVWGNLGDGGENEKKKVSERYCQ